MIGGSGSGNTIVLSNLTNDQQDVDKVNLCAKALCEEKYQFLTDNRKKVGCIMIPKLLLNT